MKYWETWDIEGGPIHYTEITANPDVQEIMLRAQGNLTREGYWRDVATDLAILVDGLKKRINDLESALAKKER